MLMPTDPRFLPREKLEEAVAAGQPAPGGLTRWAAGGVAGGSISAASLANIIAHVWPGWAEVAPDVAAILIAVGAVVVGWLNRRSVQP